MTQFDAMGSKVYSAEEFQREFAGLTETCAIASALLTKDSDQLTGVWRGMVEAGMADQIMQNLAATWSKLATLAEAVDVAQSRLRSVSG